jgi:pimeloyl-ACP methyl ester carboxylesterase
LGEKDDVIDVGLAKYMAELLGGGDRVRMGVLSGAEHNLILERW